MSRLIEIVDPGDTGSLIAALASALSHDGPALLPAVTVPARLPAAVSQKVAVILETSGSTGRPKRVMLSADALLTNAAASDVALGVSGQWLLALPAQYVGGLNVLVRSIASGTIPVTIEPGSFTSTRFVEAVHRMDGAHRFTSLVPAQLARILASDEATEAARAFDRILLGGQVAPQDLLESASALGVAVTRTYGATETSGGCVWDGMPIGDTVVRVLDGRVELAGSSLAEGYLDDDRRTAFAFRESNGRRWYRTDDAGEIIDGALTVLGRLDDIIVSGGVKVSIAAVERTVRELAGLSDAVVVAVPDVSWGEVAIVVTTTDAVLERVRTAVSLRLGAAAAPARILLLDTLPMLGSGKPDRVAIAALAAR